MSFGACAARRGSIGASEAAPGMPSMAARSAASAVGAEASSAYGSAVCPVPYSCSVSSSTILKSSGSSGSPTSGSFRAMSKSSSLSSSAFGAAGGGGGGGNLHRGGDRLGDLESRGLRGRSRRDRHRLVVVVAVKLIVQIVIILPHRALLGRGLAPALARSDRRAVDSGRRVARVSRDCQSSRRWPAEKRATRGFSLVRDEFAAASRPHRSVQAGSGRRHTVCAREGARGAMSEYQLRAECRGHEDDVRGARQAPIPLAGLTLDRPSDLAR